jgi:hypothetical protein
MAKEACPRCRAPDAVALDSVVGRCDRCAAGIRLVACGACGRGVPVPHAWTVFTCPDCLSWNHLGRRPEPARAPSRLDEVFSEPRGRVPSVAPAASPTAGPVRLRDRWRALIAVLMGSRLLSVGGAAFWS